MAATPAERPGLWTRVLDVFRPPSRVLWPGAAGLEAHGIDLLGQTRGTALGRRLARTNVQLSASYAPIFAAIRWREQAITRPQIVLQQRSGGEWRELGELRDPNVHPALAALKRVNATTTTRQGIGGVERGKLTFGAQYWLKRRDGLGTPREFEVWPGSQVRAVPRKDRPWEPDHFERWTPDGRQITVGPEDVIWFRHIVHPEDPMLSLSPIGAIRVQADSNLEGLRAQQRYWDQGMQPGGFLVPKEEGIGEAEIQRIQERMRSEFVGTDNAQRWHFLENAFEIIGNMSNTDLQFVEQQKWGVQEAARAFELTPLALKDFERATYSNADQASTQDWETTRNALDFTVEELNEFYIQPDFGEDFRLQARYAGIAALQDSMKTAAEVDEIRLKSAYTTVNELRKRDGMDPVEWGDEPIVPSNMLPLGAAMEQTSVQGAAGVEEPRAFEFTFNQAGQRVRRVVERNDDGEIVAVVEDAG